MNVDAEAEFVAALKAAPGDALLVSAFADFLEERGDPRAPWVRDDAVRPWMGLDYRDPLPALLGAVRAERKLTAARKALAAVGAPAVEALAAMLAEPPAVRDRAAKSLAALKSLARPAVPSLLAALDAEPSREVARAIATIRPEPGTDVGPLVRTLERGDDFVAPVIRRLLKKMRAGKTAATELSARLRCGDEAGRVAAVRAVANLGTRAAVGRLTPALADASPVVRVAAVQALGRLPFDALTEVPLLRAAADADPAVRGSALEAFRRWRRERSFAVFDRVRVMLADADDVVRAAATATLAEVAPHSGFPVGDFVRRLADPSPGVRVAAAAALGHDAATTDVDALAALICALDDPAVEVAFRATASLTRRRSLPAEAEGPLLRAHARIASELAPGCRPACLRALSLSAAPSPASLAVIRDALADERLRPDAVHAVFFLGEAAAPLATDLVARARAVLPAVDAEEINAAIATRDPAAVAALADLVRTTEHPAPLADAIAFYGGGNEWAILSACLDRLAASAGRERQALVAAVAAVAGGMDLRERPGMSDTLLSLWRDPSIRPLELARILWWLDLYEPGLFAAECRRLAASSGDGHAADCFAALADDISDEDAARRVPADALAVAARNPDARIRAAAAEIAFHHPSDEARTLLGVMREDAAPAVAAAARRLLGLREAFGR